MPKRGFVGAIALAIVMAFAVQPASGALGDVETPTVFGPQATGPGNTPFLATDVDLASRGYVEEEYEYSGDAFRYDRTGADNVTATKITTGGPGSDGKFPYRTRMIVRRPTNPADFNGTVIVEWLNVTAGFDLEWNWYGDPQYLIDNGYAWVGISAQNAGINYLKTFNPLRYGDLVNPDPLPNPQNDGDALSYEMYSAGVKAVLGAGNGSNPLGGLTPTKVIASGESQSGSRLASYYNKIQPLHELVDAFLLTVSTNTLRDDRPEKAIRVISETENRTQRTEPDIPATYRQWEVAGGSHLPRMAFDNAEALLKRDVATLDVDCERFPLSKVQWPFVVNSAIDKLVTWDNGGAAPPTGPRGVYTDPTTIERDQYGIAKGGIRLPEVDIPVAVNTGVNAARPGGTAPFSVFCGLLGSNEVLPDSTLTTLYRDYGDYVDRTAPAVQTVADKGFILQQDVPRLQQMYEEVPNLRPTVPVADMTKSNGKLTLTWRGTEAKQSTFVLEHSKDKGKKWSPVKGAEALDDPVFKFTGKGEKDGKWIYRVRSATIIPANVEAPETTVTTPNSDVSGRVTVDGTAPKLKLKCPDEAERGSKAFAKVKAKDKGVGLKKDPSGKIKIDTRRVGTETIAVKAKDKLGNKTKKKCKVKIVR